MLASQPDNSDVTSAATRGAKLRPIAGAGLGACCCDGVPQESTAQPTAHLSEPREAAHPDVNCAGHQSHMP